MADDVGPRIAGDRPIVHEFRLRNPTDRPIRILGAMASTPCCSSIGPIPRSIPARGEAVFPAEFRPGSQSGRKRLQFVVATDREECPKVELSLTVDLQPSWEVGPVGDAPCRVPVGSPVSRSYRVVTRSRGEDGLTPPTDLEVGGPFRGRFVGDPVTRRTPGGTVETERVVEVELPATPEPGIASGDLRLTWADGTTRTHPIRWEITPLVRPTPPALVVRSGDPARRVAVTVRSEDRPIRIGGVSGASLAEPFVSGAEASSVQLLELAIDPARVVRDGRAEIEIATDHPAHPILKLKVLIVPREGEVAS